MVVWNLSLPELYPLSHLTSLILCLYFPSFHFLSAHLYLAMLLKHKGGREEVENQKPNEINGPDEDASCNGEDSLVQI